VFAVAFAVLAAGAIILTLNVLLLVFLLSHIICLLGNSQIPSEPTDFLFLPITKHSIVGWAHQLLSEPESSWILPVPFGCRSFDLHAEG
jgi:hypothetical protein